MRFSSCIWALGLLFVLQSGHGSADESAMSMIIESIGFATESLLNLQGMAEEKLKQAKESENPAEVLNTEGILQIVGDFLSKASQTAEEIHSNITDDDDIPSLQTEVESYEREIELLELQINQPVSRSGKKGKWAVFKGFSRRVKSFTDHTSNIRESMKRKLRKGEEYRQKVGKTVEQVNKVIKQAENFTSTFDRPKGGMASEMTKQGDENLAVRFVAGLDSGLNSAQGILEVINIIPIKVPGLTAIKSAVIAIRGVVGALSGKNLDEPLVAAMEAVYEVTNIDAAIRSAAGCMNFFADVVANFGGGGTMLHSFLLGMAEFLTKVADTIKSALTSAVKYIQSTLKAAWNKMFG